MNNTKTRDLQVLTLDSMQSVSAKEIQNGVSYLAVMENDLEILQKALGAEVN